MRSPLAFLAAAGLAGLVATASGCPIYSDSNDARICDGQTCELCPSGDNYYSDGFCHPYFCRGNADCPGGYTCDRVDEQCYGNGYTSGRPVDGGATYDAGACPTVGCAPGFVCHLDGQVASCVPLASGGDSGVVDAGPSLFDSGPVSCHRDADCPTGGARCLDGTCVAPADQCTDGTQCSSGGQCVQGACTPACDASGAHACPTGFGCDTVKGVCTGNPTPCGEEPGAVACGAGLVCAQDHCVAPCSASGACGTGLVCVEGGCVPNERAAFTCATEGVQDACAAGSLCLHHSCYIACALDAGASACKSADAFNVCKSVATASGSYSVCGSNASLGTECDPTQGKACASPLLCIDGFCR